MDIGPFREKLQRELDELLATSASSAGSRDRVMLDQQSVGRLSRMDAMQQQSMARAAEQRRQARIARLRSALKRLDEDDFGYCVTCGEEIEPKRLAADPSVPVCSGCAGA